MNTPVKHYHFKSVDSTMNVAKALALGETPTSPGSLVGAHSLPRDAGSCSKACAPRWLQTIAATIARCIPCRTASGTGPRIGKVDINSPQLSDLAIITADEQTAGRGRFDRRWHSGKGAGLYVTYQFSIPAGSSKMNGFSLAVGVAVKRALSKFGVQAQLKWPNDVVVFNEQRELCKLAGILVDLVSMGGADGEKLYVSTGIGLNLKKTSYPENFTPKAISLEEVLGCACRDAKSCVSPRDSVVLHEISTEFWKICDEYFRDGFSGSLKTEWESSNVCANKKVKICLSAGLLDQTGTMLGIHDDGSLLLRDEKTDAVVRISIGDVSLRLA